MTFIKINYLLIHCDEHKERETNIEKNKLTLNKEIQIFKGFYTKQNSILKDDIVAFLKKYDMNLKMEQLSFWRPGEIGCYLSHHMIIRDIMISLPKNHYTVIFEDDVTFKETLHEDIEKIINNFNNLR
jgi:GR25 family glycosyltransferase involved in LPS biosynthesis